MILLVRPRNRTPNLKRKIPQSVKWKNERLSKLKTEVTLVCFMI